MGAYSSAPTTQVSESDEEPEEEVNRSSLQGKEEEDVAKESSTIDKIDESQDENPSNILNVDAEKILTKSKIVTETSKKAISVLVKELQTTKSFLGKLHQVQSQREILEKRLKDELTNIQKMKKKLKEAKEESKLLENELIRERELVIFKKLKLREFCKLGIIVQQLSNRLQATLLTQTFQNNQILQLLVQQRNEVKAQRNTLKQERIKCDQKKRELEQKFKDLKMDEDQYEDCSKLLAENLGKKRLEEKEKAFSDLDSSLEAELENISCNDEAGWDQTKNWKVSMFKLDEKLIETESVEIQIQMRKKPFGKGEFRFAYLAKTNVNLWPGFPEKSCVAKIFITKRNSKREKRVSLETIFTYLTAASYANKFNATVNPPNKIAFVIPLLASQEKEERYMTLEPLLPGTFERYTNNLNYLNESAVIPQAFSHFSHITSSKKLMVVDLQGTMIDGNYLLTDPSINALDGTIFESGNHSEKGFEEFYKLHKCSELCAKFIKK